MHSFRHVTPVEVRFVDIDAFGHVNNANYLTYAEQARFLYFEEVLGNKVNWKSEGLILASAKVDYIKPILLHDKIKVYTRCCRFGTKSMDFEYEVFNEKEAKEIKARMFTTLVAFNYLKNCSIPVPEDWKNTVLNFEEGR